MVIDSNFSILHDDLSVYLATGDRALLNDGMLRLSHGRVMITVDACGDGFKITTVDVSAPGETLARCDCREDRLDDMLTEACLTALNYETAMPECADCADCYSEFFRTVGENRLKLRFVTGEEKARVLNLVSDNFVDGNPRALWLGLKCQPARLGNPDRDPYWRLLDYISDCRMLYFIIDTDNIDYAVYHGAMKEIHTFIGDCECLDEYYLMSPDGNELWCATDHDELLYSTYL